MTARVPIVDKTQFVLGFMRWLPDFESQSGWSVMAAARQS